MRLATRVLRFNLLPGALGSPRRSGSRRAHLRAEHVEALCENVVPSRSASAWQASTFCEPSLQTCAARGHLPGQRSKTLQFSIAPKNLDVGIFEHPSQCVGGCGNGYAVSDVYYVEVCVYAHVCRNRDRLFSLEYGDEFECDFDEQKFAELRGWLN